MSINVSIILKSYEIKKKYKTKIKCIIIFSKKKLLFFYFIQQKKTILINIPHTQIVNP